MRIVNKSCFSAFFRLVAAARLSFIGLMVFGFWVYVAILAPVVAPCEPMEKNYDASQRLKKLHPPSMEHLLGTKLLSRDVFSQLVWGARPALVIGFSLLLVTHDIALGHRES